MGIPVSKFYINGIKHQKYFNCLRQLDDKKRPFNHISEQ